MPAPGSGPRPYQGDIMKKTLRFAALAAVLGLTSWLAMGGQAQASPPCSYLQGKFCEQGFIICGSVSVGSECFCNYGHWDCGCTTDDTGTMTCP